MFESNGMGLGWWLAAAADSVSRTAELLVTVTCLSVCLPSVKIIPSPEIEMHEHLGLNIPFFSLCKIRIQPDDSHKP